MKVEKRHRDKIERIPNGEEYQVYIANDGTEYADEKDALARKEFTFLTIYL